jgi:hypothetical protein
MSISTNPLTSALDGGEWSASRPGRFTPRERAPIIHWIGGWAGSRTDTLLYIILLSIYAPQAKFKYLETTLTNQNDIRDEIKSRLNSGNACYYSVRNFCLPVLYKKN